MRTSWFINNHLLSVTSHGRRYEEALRGLHKGTNPINEDSAFIT